MNDHDTRPPNPILKNGTPNEINIGIIFDSIGVVIKTPSVKVGDTGRYHIPINFDGVEHTIVLTTAQLLNNHSVFATQFTDMFNKRLYVSKADKHWLKFSDWIMAVATPGAPDETPGVMAAHVLFDYIAHKGKVTDDKTKLTDLSDCSRLVKHTSGGGDWCVLPAGAVSELMSDLQIKVDQTTLSQAMVVCGMKRKGNHTVRYKPGSKGTVKCWWFSSEELFKVNPDMEGF